MATIDKAEPLLDQDPANHDSRRRLIGYSAFVLLGIVIAIVVIDDGTRALIADAWRQMLDISPALLLLIFIFKIGQALFSALTWRNILAAAYPQQPLSLGFVMGVDQGQDAVNLVSPARAGTWAMLGLFGLSIRGSRAPTLMAVWGVQSLAYAFFALVNYVVLAFFLPGAVEDLGDVTHRIRTFGADRPLISIVISLVVVVAAIYLMVYLRRKVIDFKTQVLRGAAILGTPRRYLRLVFLPSLLSLLCRFGAYGVLLAAFDIPVTGWTIALATGSHAFAGAVRVTPGGVGTTQAIDVIALRKYAPADTVTAYSLSEAAITAIASFTISAAALIITLGFGGAFALLRQRNQIAGTVPPPN